MNFLQKILVALFILISGSLKAGEVTDLYENEEFDAAYRLGYAQALNDDPESLFIIGKISGIVRLSKGIHLSFKFEFNISFKIFCSSKFFPVAK